MIDIRPFESSDWANTWQIIEPVFRAGETYAFSPTITKSEAHTVWIDAPQQTYVAVNEENTIVGTYYIKPNQSALGAHVCNCGYIVGSAARGKGLATQLCKHSQAEAKRLGFHAMQFNLVVATNTIAIRLWHKLGFNTVGKLPGAFNHAQQGFVDAFVMYKQL